MVPVAVPRKMPVFKKCCTHMLDYKTNLSFSVDFAVVYSSIGALLNIYKRGKGATSDKYTVFVLFQNYSHFSVKGKETD